MKTLFVCSGALLSATAALADPTRPADGWQPVTDTSIVAAPALPTLQLIKQTVDGRVAMLNGTLVKQGQRYQQYLVADIQPTQVTLDANGERIRLSLLTTAIKHYD